MQRVTTRSAIAAFLGAGLLMVAVVGWTATSAMAAVAGEDCDDATLIPGGTFIDSDTTTGRNDDYDLDSDAANGDCGSGQTATQETGLGPDAVYKLNTPDDCVVTITATPIVAWNLSLYVVSGSCNPGGFSNATCIALDDDNGDGELETVVFAAQAGVTYFIFVDGVNGSNGDFDFELDCCPDDDGDLVCNAVDVCAGDDASGDTDGDGVCDDSDVCNGDDASGDTDGDSVCDDIDVCTGDDATGDADGDGVCDDIDVCDGNDGSGDTDGDGLCDDVDPCPADNPNDSDGDGIVDCADNCADTPNADQTDTDGNGVGDACDAPPAGQPAGDCGCGASSILMMPAMLSGIGWMRRRSFRARPSR